MSKNMEVILDGNSVCRLHESHQRSIMKSHDGLQRSPSCIRPLIRLSSEPDFGVFDDDDMSPIL